MTQEEFDLMMSDEEKKFGCRKYRLQETSRGNYEPDRTGRKERFYETVH